MEVSYRGYINDIVYSILTDKKVREFVKKNVMKKRYLFVGLLGGNWYIASAKEAGKEHLGVVSDGKNLFRLKRDTFLIKAVHGIQFPMLAKVTHYKYFERRCPAQVLDFLGYSAEKTEYIEGNCLRVRLVLSEALLSRIVLDGYMKVYMANGKTNVDGLIVKLPFQVKSEGMYPGIEFKKNRIIVTSANRHAPPFYPGDAYSYKRNEKKILEKLFSLVQDSRLSKVEPRVQGVLSEL